MKTHFGKMKNENSLIWHEIEWMKDPEGCFYPQEDLPVDTVLICKYVENDNIYFREMMYGDTGEGFDALQEVIGKCWDIQKQKWDIDTDWDDDYFPIAYALYPDLTGSP